MDMRNIGNEYAIKKIDYEKKYSEKKKTKTQENDSQTSKRDTSICEGIILEFSKEEKENEVQDEIDTMIEDDLEEQKEAMLKKLEERLERLEEKNKIKNEEANTKKKVLHYSYKKVSANIMRAKTLTQASSALTSAISNLNTLKRKAMTGKYDEDELDIALKHAKRMVRTAKKKVRHLKYEQKQDQKDESLVGMEKKKARRRIVEDSHIEEKQEIQKLEEQMESIKKQRKHVNRKDEKNDILNADMEYLRKKIELIKAGKGDFAIMNSMGTTNMNEGISSVIAQTADVQVKNEALNASMQGSNDMVSASGVIDIMI